MGQLFLAFHLAFFFCMISKGSSGESRRNIGIPGAYPDISLFGVRVNSTMKLRRITLNTDADFVRFFPESFLQLFYLIDRTNLYRA